jgi:hypothetical protein
VVGDVHVDMPKGKSGAFEIVNVCVTKCIENGVKTEIIKIDTK